MVAMESQRGEEMTLREWVSDWRSRTFKDSTSCSVWASDLISDMDRAGILDSIVSTKINIIGEFVELPANECKVIDAGEEK
jgi:hypothetical protein